MIERATEFSTQTWSWSFFRVPPGIRNTLQSNSGTAMSGASRRKSGHILVVDDIVANARMLADVLERENHRVTAVGSGYEALSALAQRAYDLVLLDVMMPEMDGYEVCRRVREDAR